MKFAHAMIRVQNLERSIGFYRDLLGLHETGRKEIGDEATLVFLCDDDERRVVELTFNRDGRGYDLGNQFGHLAFYTTDLDGVIRDVERRGLPFRRSRAELKSRYIFVKDPDGYDIEILQG